MDEKKEGRKNLFITIGEALIKLGVGMSTCWFFIGKAKNEPKKWN
jgi:hypothetical protein